MNPLKRDADVYRCDDIVVVDRVSEPGSRKDAFYIGCCASNRYRTVGPQLRYYARCFLSKGSLRDTS
jgi:hypothetical protein